MVGMNAQHSSASGPKLSLAPVPGLSPDPGKGEGFEHEGRWRRVSLEGCGHIGQGKIKTRMIGSVKGPLARGEIGGGNRAARLFGSRGSRRRTMSGPLSAAASQASAPLVEPDSIDELDEDEALAALHEASRRQRVLVAVMVLAALVGCWGVVWLGSEGEKADVAGEEVAVPGVLEIVPEQIPAPVDFSPAREAEGERIDDVVPAAGLADTKKSKRKGIKKRAKSKASRAHQSAECVDTVKQANSAKQSRDWDSLVVLTQKKQCWPHDKKTAWTILRLQALFQDEAYKDCISVGAKSSKSTLRSKEVQKWLRNCNGSI